MARQSAEKIAELQDLVRRKREELDEDSFRYFLGEQALKLGHGGQTLMVRLSGVSVSTVRKGMSEVRARFLGEEPEPARKKARSPKGDSRTAKSSRADSEYLFRQISELAQTFITTRQPMIALDIRDGKPASGSDAAKAVFSGDTRAPEFRKLAADRDAVYLGTLPVNEDFAVNAIYQWWLHTGKQRFPKAGNLYVVASGNKSHMFREESCAVLLAELAEVIGINICVSVMPPRGYFKWNGIKRRLLCYRSAADSRSAPVPGAEICLVGCERALAESGEPGEEPPEARREFPDAIRRSGRGFDIADVVGVAPYGDWNYLVRGFIKITFINE